MDVKDLRKDIEILENNLNNSSREHIARFEQKTGLSIKALSIHSERGRKFDAERENYTHLISAIIDL